MKARMVIALSMMFAGIFLVAASALLMVARASMLNWLVPLAIGGLVCIAGFVLLMTELMEASLSRGQRALVDGLQAG